MNSKENVVTVVSSVSDSQLYEMCRSFGSQALEARRKFLGLLPEVNRRKLYEKKGFSSVFHFAAVLAGVSEAQVRTVLNIERKFTDKPVLKELLVSGAVSVNKLARVAPIATQQNQDFWANNVQNLSNRAVETLVKDLHVHSKVQQSELIVKEPNLSQEIKEKLVVLEEKGIDINQIIADALQQREQEIAEEKDKLAKKAEQKLIEQITEEKNVARTAPVATKKLLKKEFGQKCAIFTCRNKAEAIHHTNRFSISHDHNPYYLAPLCKAHHEIAHTVDVKVIAKRQK